MKKKLNNAGFTLIELLAVITIMGILMMVAIPSVSRTIENSRRDTFMDNALIYVDTVRTAVLSDEVKCCQVANCAESAMVSASATKNATYYFEINTGQQQTKDLMETVATSSWGGAQITGYVAWTKAASGERTTTTYSVCLKDTGNHGMNGFTEETAVTRSKILTTGASCSGAPSGALKCILK